MHNQKKIIKSIGVGANKGVQYEGNRDAGAAGKAVHIQHWVQQLVPDLRPNIPKSTDSHSINRTNDNAMILLIAFLSRSE